MHSYHSEIQTPRSSCWHSAKISRTQQFLFRLRSHCLGSCCRRYHRFRLRARVFVVTAFSKIAQCVHRIRGETPRSRCHPFAIAIATLCSARRAPPACFAQQTNTNIANDRLLALCYCLHHTHIKASKEPIAHKQASTHTVQNPDADFAAFALGNTQEDTTKSPRNPTPVALLVEALSPHLILLRPQSYQTRMCARGSQALEDRSAFLGNVLRN